MRQAAPGSVRLQEQAKALALEYIEAAPARDRILLVEADGAPAVRIPFTRDRQLLREAILAAEPGWTALDLEAATELAAGALRLALDADGARLPDRPAGDEAVYIGPGQIAGPSVRESALPQLRYLETEAPRDEVGLVSLRAAADPAEPAKWDIRLTARNYRPQPTEASFEFYFAGRRLGGRQVRLPAAGEGQLHFTLRTRRPGRLLARVAEEAGYDGNNEAAVEIPTRDPIRLQILGASPANFEPLLAPGGRIEPEFVDSRSELEADAIHVWARGGGEAPSRRAIYLAPPGTASPAGEAASARDQRIDEWSPSHPLATGIRDPDLMPSETRVFEVGATDEVVAGTAGGPVILARSQPGKRFVAFGFDLADESVRGRLAAPLLFANAVNWLAPDAFRPETVEARPPGAIAIEAPHADRSQVAVRTAAGESVPWLLSDGAVRFYAGERDTYKVTTAERRITLFLNQPELGEAAWEPPATVARGLPRARAAGDPWAPWPWLAALAALILLADWIRFGRGRHLGPANSPAPASGEAAQ